MPLSTAMQNLLRMQKRQPLDLPVGWRLRFQAYHEKRANVKQVLAPAMPTAGAIDCVRRFVWRLHLRAGCAQNKTGRSQNSAWLRPVHVPLLYHDSQPNVNPYFRLGFLCHGNFTKTRTFLLTKYRISSILRIYHTVFDTSRRYQVDFTPVKITRTRRSELELAWIELQAREGRRLDLQEVVDFVLAAGLSVLGVHANGATPSVPMIAPDNGLVNAS